jgi:hypothetical protein
MPRFWVIPLLLGLAGCTAWPLWPDPRLARLELDGGGGRLQPHGGRERVLQLQPGGQRLLLDYRFRVEPGNIGGAARPLQRTCQLLLEYADLRAGQRYRLRAGAHGFRPWARLYDAQGRELARAREQGCRG